MAKLIYSAIASLDGYIADEEGKFDWAEPDEEVHAFINDLERPVGTYLYGRRMYETMADWETDPTLAAQSEPMQDFARIWMAAEKIVYSRTLETATTRRTRIERSFEPEAVRRLKRPRKRTSRLAVPTSPPTRSGQDWSTNVTCSSRPSSSVAASRHFPTMYDWTSSYWPSTASREAWFTSDTGP